MGEYFIEFEPKDLRFIVDIVGGFEVDSECDFRTVPLATIVGLAALLLAGHFISVGI